MQLKKNPRDPQFVDSRGQYEDDPIETVEEVMDVRPEPATRTRPRPEAEEGAPQPQRQATPRAESLVDSHSSFDGKYETAQDLRVQGTVSGEIACGGMLTIEQGATANASILARDAIVRGRVDGQIVCKGRLLITATAIVTGTVKAGAVVVEEGASLNGTVEMVATAPVSAAAGPAPEPPQIGLNEAPVPDLAAESVASVTSSRGPNWGTERRASVTPDSTVSRAGRQAPSFAFVPTSEERAAAERT